MSLSWKPLPSKLNPIWSCMGFILHFAVLHLFISGRKESLPLPHAEHFTHFTALELHKQLFSEETEVQRDLATAQGHKAWRWRKPGLPRELTLFLCCWGGFCHGVCVGGALLLPCLLGRLVAACSSPSDPLLLLGPLWPFHQNHVRHGARHQANKTPSPVIITQPTEVSINHLFV